MATLQITKKLHIPSLIDIQGTTFAERYAAGVYWRLFGSCALCEASYRFTREVKQEIGR